MTSIRRYLFAVLLSTVCIVNFTAALHGYKRSMAEADSLLEERLQGDALSLAKLAASNVVLPPDLYGNDRFYQVWRGQTLAFRSENAPAKAVVDMTSALHHANVNGYRWRIYVYPYMDNGDSVVIAHRYDLYTTFIEQMVVKSILPIIWVLPILGILVWFIVSIGLAKLNNLASALIARKPNDLRPLPVDNYPAELAVVVSSINQLLQRLAVVFEREQRFAADAAHELRTPLAALKVSLHNLQQEPIADTETLAGLDSSIDRMNHSIEQILSLYRLTPEKFQATSKACDLSAIARNCIAQLYSLCEAKQQTISFDGPDTAALVLGDEFALITVIRNLIDNASKYSPNQSEILVTLNCDTQRVRLTVADSGPGIPEADYRRALSRFYRVGGDQHASEVVGSGLGLSIVEHIVGLHTGRIQLGKSAALGGLEVCIDFPVSDGVAA